jgi:valyl-tRNA synthetase
LVLWHPFIPFVTEIIWKEIGENNLLIIQKWPGVISTRIENDFEMIKDVITAIRNARAENNVEPAKKVEVVIYAGEKKEFFKSQAILLASLRTGASGIRIADKGEKINDAIFTTVNEIEIYLIGAVDKAKESERLKKEIKNLEKIIASAKVRLSNKEFTAKAPAEVVKKEKEKLKGWQAELKSLKSR